MEDLMIAICTEHLEVLRTKLGERGLLPFVTYSDGAESLRRLAKNFNGKENWCPLGRAQSGIMANAIRVFGSELVPKDAGCTCPVCYAIANCPCQKTHCGAKEWLTAAADAEFERAVAYGLVASA